MGIPRDRIEDRNSDGHPKPRVFLGSEKGTTLEHRRRILSGALELIRARHAIALDPFFRLWEGIWHNLKLLEDYARKRKRIPEGWAPLLTELREILATSSSADLCIGDEDRNRIEGILSRIAGKSVDIS